MSARKKRPVLYELVARSQRPRGWSTPAPSAPATPPPSAPPAVARAPRPVVEPQPEPEPASPTSASVRVVGGRVYLKLGWPQLVVFGLLLIVIVVAAFQAGARSARPPAANSSDLGEILSPEPEPEQPAAEPVDLRPGHRPNGGAAVSPPRRPERSATPPRDETPPPRDERPPEPVTLREGSTYIIVQHVPKSSAGQQAAERIVAFLASNGVTCAVRTGNTGRDLEVVATEAFLTKQSDGGAAEREKRRAAQYQERVRKLGEEYNIIGGYTFEGCYLRTF